MFDDSTKWNFWYNEIDNKEWGDIAVINEALWFVELLDLYMRTGKGFGKSSKLRKNWDGKGEVHGNSEGTQTL